MKPVVIVTGAAQGIGYAVAKKLLEKEYVVVWVDLQEEQILCHATDFGGVAMALDVSNSESMDAFVEQVNSEVGQVDALVNAAGIVKTQPIYEITVEQFRKTFAVNVEGAFFLQRACAESMKRAGRPGSIVNLSSISGFLPKLEQVDYGASKAAIVSLTRSMALCYGPFGIRVNAVAPGVIDTPLTQQIANQRSALRGVSPEETLRPTLQSTPLGRIGSSEEVADAVAFLISSEASYITGQTLDVCGGFLMR